MRASFFGLSLVGLSLAVSACGMPEPSAIAPASNVLEAPALAKSAPIPPTKPQTPMTTVTRYKIDGQCSALEAHDLDVPRDHALDATVKTIIGDRSTGDFRIAGYRLDVDAATKTATIDLRLPYNTARSIHSLSHCEQFALFGELQKTLTANSAWGIESVNFQLQGETIGQ